MDESFLNGSGSGSVDRPSRVGKSALRGACGGGGSAKDALIARAVSTVSL